MKLCEVELSVNSIEFFAILLTNFFFPFAVIELKANQLQFSKTQRGRTMLVYEGFKYVINRESQKNTFWRCNRYVKYGCRAGAVTSKPGYGDVTIRLTHEHSHQMEKNVGPTYECVG